MIRLSRSKSIVTTSLPYKIYEDDDGAALTAFPVLRAVARTNPAAGEGPLATGKVLQLNVSECIRDDMEAFDHVNLDERSTFESEGSPTTEGDRSPTAGVELGLTFEDEGSPNSAEGGGTFEDEGSPGSSPRGASSGPLSTIERTALPDSFGFDSPFDSDFDSGGNAFESERGTGDGVSGLLSHRLSSAATRITQRTKKKQMEAKMTTQEEREDQAVLEMRAARILHPLGRFRKRWDLLQVFALGYVAMIVPYRIGFSDDTSPFEFW